MTGFMAAPAMTRLMAMTAMTILRAAPGLTSSVAATAVTLQSYQASNAGVTVRLDSFDNPVQAGHFASPAQGGHAEGDTFRTITVNGVPFYDIENLAGSAYADVLVGDSRNNKSWGISR